MQRARGVVKDLSKPEMSSGQTFFKCILSSEKMEIPPAFVLQMQGALANRVILRDRYKNLWPMEVEKNGDVWCFKKGWPQFYEEISLEPGNFLVFEYKGDNLFDFKLLGHNACGKKGVGALKVRVKEEELEEYKAEEEEEEDLKKKGVGSLTFRVEEEELEEYKDEEEEEGDLREENEEYSVDDDDEDNDVEEDDPDYAQEEEVNISKKTKPENKSKSSRMCNRNLRRLDAFGVGTFPNKCKYNKKNATEKKGVEAPMCKVTEEEEEEEEEVEDEKENEEAADSDENDEDEGNMQMEDGYDEEEEQLNIFKKIKPKSKSNSSRTSKRSLNTFGIGTIPSTRDYKKKNIPDCYGADIFKSGLATRPKNPYFVSRSRTQRRNELYIPKDVIVDYHLNIPEKLFLVDERGNKWETKIKQWKDGRLWCTRGWRSLCNVNNINMDDTCICEFVQEEGCKDLYILVHVVDGAGTSAPV